MGDLIITGGYAPNPCPYNGDCTGQWYDYALINQLTPDTPPPIANSHKVCACDNGLAPPRQRWTIYYACDTGYEYDGAACVLVGAAKKFVGDGLAGADT